MNTNHFDYQVVECIDNEHETRMARREARVRYVLDAVNDFLSTVLCHKLKELVRDGKLCGGKPVVVVNLARGPVVGIQCTASYVEKTSHTCSLNSFRELACGLEGCEQGSGEKHVKNLMAFDVGRWNLLKVPGNKGNPWLSGHDFEKT